MTSEPLTREFTAMSADKTSIERETNRARVATALAVALAVTLTIGFAVGFWTRDQSRTDVAVPAGDSVDVGFAQDMSVHHGQAVEMSSIALSRAVDPAVRTLAYDVLTTQQSQIGTMQGWLMLWNHAPIADQPMRWMNSTDPTRTSTSMPGHSMSASDTSTRMPGMATTEELTTLRRTSGPEFDTLYLQLLLRHHEGGIPMARFAREHALGSATRTLAAQIDATQSAESETLRQLLAQRNAATLPMN